MKSFRIEIQKRKCKKSGAIFQTALFADKLGDKYGKKFFITEAGEVAFYELIIDKSEPMEFADIETYYLAEFEKRSEILKPSLGEAWRYFADLSQQGHRWYLGAMYYHELCYFPGELLVSDLVESTHIESETQELRFTKWNSLTGQSKAEMMKSFFDEPVKGHDPIVKHLYNE